MTTPECAWNGSHLLKVSTSALAVAAHLLATTLAVLSVCLSAVTLPWMGLWLAVILVLSVYGYRGLRAQPQLLFQLTGGECFRLSADVNQPRTPVSIRRSWHLSSWLFQIQYREPAQRRWRSVLVWPDSACVETRRILRSHEAFNFSPPLQIPD